jgi:hypothetical protein
MAFDTLIRVADPHHLNADPDPAFHNNADPDTSVHFNVDPDADPAPYQSVENLSNRLLLLSSTMLKLYSKVSQQFCY